MISRQATHDHTDRWVTPKKGVVADQISFMQHAPPASHEQLLTCVCQGSRCEAWTLTQAMTVACAATCDACLT